TPPAAVPAGRVHGQHGPAGVVEAAGEPEIAVVAGRESVHGGQEPQHALTGRAHDATCPRSRRCASPSSTSLIPRTAGGSIRPARDPTSVGVRPAASAACTRAPHASI